MTYECWFSHRYSVQFALLNVRLAHSSQNVRFNWTYVLVHGIPFMMVLFLFWWGIVYPWAWVANYPDCYLIPGTPLKESQIAFQHRETHCYDECCEMKP